MSAILYAALALLILTRLPTNFVVGVGIFLVTGALVLSLQAGGVTQEQKTAVRQVGHTLQVRQHKIVRTLDREVGQPLRTAWSHLSHEVVQTIKLARI